MIRIIILVTRHRSSSAPRSSTPPSARCCAPRRSSPAAWCGSATWSRTPASSPTRPSSAAPRSARPAASASRRCSKLAGRFADRPRSRLDHRGFRDPRQPRDPPRRIIEALLAAAIGKDHALGDGRDVTIALIAPCARSRSSLAGHRAPRVGNACTTPAAAASTRPSSFPAPRRQACGSPARPNATIEIVTLACAVARGEIIKMDDLAMQRVPRTRLSADAVTDPDQAIGLAARNAITANRPIAAAELMKPEVVQRGASVTIIYQVPGVMLAVRGKASEGGAEGDMIDVVNVQSNRTLRATVAGPGQVTVTSMAARLLASAEQIETPVRSQPVSGAK